LVHYLVTAAISSSTVVWLNSLLVYSSMLETIVNAYVFVTRLPYFRAVARAHIRCTAIGPATTSTEQ